MRLPDKLKPTWRTIRVIRISKGLDDGLRMFIVGPYFYEIFKRLSGEQTALLYASLVWAIYSGLIAILEIPTGLFADVFGRVRAVTSSFVCNLIYALGLASLVLFHHSAIVIAVVLLVSIFRAAAVTFYNGSFTAWVVDAIREQEPSFGYDRLLSKGYVYYSCSMIVGAAIGVTLYLHEVAYSAFVIGALICLSCTTYCATEMHESRRLHFVNLRHFWSTATTKMANTLVSAVRVCHRVPVLWWLILTFAGYWFLFNTIGYLWPMALGSLFGTNKWSIPWYIMAFGVPATCALSSQLLSWWSARHHHKTGQKMPTSILLKWMIGTCLFGSLPIFVLGVAQWMGSIPFWLFASCVLALQSSQGIVDPAYSALINYYIPNENSQERATIMSVGAMIQGLLLLIFLVPSNMSSSGEAGVAGWILPSGIVLAILVLSVSRIATYEKNNRRDVMLVCDGN